MIGVHLLGDGLKRYLANTAWLVFEKSIRIVYYLVIGSWVVRYLGPAQFGTLSFAQSLVGLFAPLSALGLTNVLSLHLVKQPEKIPTYLSTSLGLMLIGCVLSYLGIGVVVFLHGYGALTNNAILIIGFCAFFQTSTLFDAYYHSKVRGKVLVLSGVASMLASSLAKAALILMQASFLIFAWTYVFDVAVLFFFLLFLFKRDVPKFSFSLFSRTTALELLKESWPYILSGLLVTIYMRIDMIMIKELMTDKAVGEYAAAVRLSEAWYFIPVVVVSALYPAIVNAKRLNPHLYLQRLSTLYFAMFYAAVIVSMASTLLASFSIKALFGSAFEQASDVLVIHIWASVFVFVGVASDKWLLTEGLQIYSAINGLIGALMNIALNLVLIPRLGIVGAAWATLISYSFSSYFCLAIWRKTRPNFLAVTLSVVRRPKF
jgi:O-antigen/teichoic acid export membrane protein